MPGAVETQNTKTETQNTEETARRQQPQQSSEERIRNRAYQLYEQRGGSGGDAESDWLRAETEIDTETTGQDH